jgi:hypothetical protein
MSDSKVVALQTRKAVDLGEAEVGFTWQVSDEDATDEPELYAASSLAVFETNINRYAFGTAWQTTQTGRLVEFALAAQLAEPSIDVAAFVARQNELNASFAEQLHEIKRQLAPHARVEADTARATKDLVSIAELVHIDDAPALFAMLSQRPSFEKCVTMCARQLERVFPDGKRRLRERDDGRFLLVVETDGDVSTAEKLFSDFLTWRVQNVGVEEPLTVTLRYV